MAMTNRVILDLSEKNTAFQSSNVLRQCTFAISDSYRSYILIHSAFLQSRFDGGLRWLREFVLILHSSSYYYYYEASSGSQVVKSNYRNITQQTCVRARVKNI